MFAYLIDKLRKKKQSQLVLDSDLCSINRMIGDELKVSINVRHYN